MNFELASSSERGLPHNSLLIYLHATVSIIVFFLNITNLKVGIFFSPKNGSAGTLLTQYLFYQAVF